MELFGMEAGKKNVGFGKAATAIWIMQLPFENKQRYSDVLSKNFLEMSMEELKAGKYYMTWGWWIGCPQVAARAVEFKPKVEPKMIFPEPDLLDHIGRFLRWIGGGC